MKNKDIHHIHSSSLSLSLSLCNFSFCRSLIFSLSRSLTHTIFLHLSQIFKANINAALFALAMKIKGGTEDCFPVFLFLFLISFFTLTHEWIIQTSSIRCLHAVADQNYHHKRVVNPNQTEGVWYENKQCQRQLTENIMTRARANPIKACANPIKACSRFISQTSLFSWSIFPKLGACKSDQSLCKSDLSLLAIYLSNFIILFISLSETVFLSGLLISSFFLNSFRPVSSQKLDR